MAYSLGKSAANPPSTLLMQLILLVLLGALNVGAMDISYCSGVNTGSTYSGVTERYQSNGACFDNCKQNYAFAILKGSVCWCSNYAPGSTTSVSSCNEGCPGIDTELCGNSARGLYGYIALSKSPSGTQGGSTSSQASSTSSSVPPTSVSSQFYQVSSTTFTAVSPSAPASPPLIGFLSSTIISLATSSTSVSTMATTLTMLSLQTSPTTTSPVTFLATTAPSSVLVVSTVTAPPVTVTSLITPSPAASSTAPPTTSSSPNPTSTSASSPPTSSASLTTSSATSTVSPATSATSAAPPATTTPPPAPAPVRSSTTTTTRSASPVITVMTVTGKMTTVTITPSEPPPSTATVTVEQADNTKGSGPLSTPGKVAGLAVGLAFIVVGLIGGIAFLFWRHHQRKKAAQNKAHGDEAPSRTRSQSMSESGLLGETGRTLPRIQTRMSTRRLGSGTTGSPEPAPSHHRLSSPRIVDQRLDPASVWTQHDNSSRASVKSLQDNQDYSRRMLRISNPDL